MRSPIHYRNRMHAVCVLHPLDRTHQSMSRFRPVLFTERTKRVTQYVTRVRQEPAPGPCWFVCVVLATIAEVFGMAGRGRPGRSIECPGGHLATRSWLHSESLAGKARLMKTRERDMLFNLSQTAAEPSVHYTRNEGGGWWARRLVSRPEEFSSRSRGKPLKRMFLV